MFMLRLIGLSTSFWALGLSALLVTSASMALAETIVLETTQETRLDFRFDPNATFDDDDILSIRIRNFGNGTAIFGIDLSPVTEALASSPGLFVQNVIMKFPKRDNPNKANDINASFQAIWGSDDTIDNWGESTVTGNTSQWNANASQWQVGSSQVVASFVSPSGDPLETVYSVSNDNLIDMVSNDTNGFATLMMISTSSVPGTGSRGWLTRNFTSPTLEVTIVPEPATIAMLSAVIGVVFRNARRRT